MTKAIPYDINIRASANGGLVAEVGCKTFCYGCSSAEKDLAAADFRNYLSDPEGMMKKYNIPEEGGAIRDCNCEVGVPRTSK